MPDPEIEVIGRVCDEFAQLADDNVRTRVLEFVAAKFGLALSRRPEHRRSDPDESDLQDEEQSQNGDDLVSRFSHKKPSENVALLTAQHYSRYGTEPFTTAEMKSQADEAGLEVPARIDMTLKAAGKPGKRFYRNHGRGSFSVTVHGAAFLKEKYRIRKGNQKKSVLGTQVAG